MREGYERDGRPARGIPEAALPKRRELYYDGKWHAPRGGYRETINPGTGASLGDCAEADASDIDAAVTSAHAAYRHWRKTKPLHRGTLLREIATVLRAHRDELAMLDSANCGNPVREMTKDVTAAASAMEFFAGLVTEIKGETVPLGEGLVNLSIREPYGVCGRILAYNHPILFAASRIGAALAAGNTLIIKPPHQAPLSAYRMMELFDGILPPGVLNIVTGGKECSEALVRHHLVPRLSLIGSVPTGRAIAKAAADRLKHVTMELGGKNACIIYPDADLNKAIRGAVDGMNFTWCGQSCGSTSRLFVHADVYDAVVSGVLRCTEAYQPGIPTEMSTTMGALISSAHLERVMRLVETGRQEGATLACGGRRPSDPSLDGGFFLEPTVFTDVIQNMRIANEEIFGPVLSILKWTDEDDLFDQVNAVDYGLTCAIWTTNISTGHRAASRAEAGYVWINNVGTHYPGVSFGGYKQSGIGREESMDELLSFTQCKSITVSL